ncbi:FkbM family methyltransferase [Catelliglobosispora koreensis]|uniref:FkbM family methyltransferase n=1 Tax=Catelliglobosispora koreensis TaxID=129052 RepID=UPI0003A16B89|nr:FkbM family methyltransferase [Catelliglobosispora koreensis]
MSLRRTLASAMPLSVLGMALRAVYPRIEPELKQLGVIMPGGGVALDIGVWFGPWAQRMRAHANEVIGIEAHPELAALAQRSLSGVRIIHAAVSDDVGEIELIVPPGGPGVGIASVQEGLVAGEAVTVPKVSIDSLDLHDVRFIKVDVEGHELAVLLGGKNTIARDHPVLLLELEERMKPVSEVVGLLESWGYTGHVYHDGQWVRLADFDLTAHQAANVHRVNQSFIRRLISPNPRYVNMVLFK